MKAKKILLALCLLVGIKLIAQPNISAPTPTQASADVISVFSDAYTNISGTNFNPNWGQGTQVSDTAVSGNNIKKYHRLDYQGTQLGSRVNASSMQSLHFDIWTVTGTQIQIFMINEGNTGGPTEQSVTLSLTQNGWNSIDIPMSSYHTSIISSISQFKIQVPGFVYQNSPFSYYLTNIYFWKPANVPTLGSFSFPTKFTNDAPFQIVPPTSNSNGAFTYTSSNPSVATINGDSITIVGNGTSTITANQAADGGFAAASTTAILTVTFAPPTDAPPTPTHLASNVISMYSNAYTNFPSINWYPNWGQSTQILNMVVAGNDIIRYSNLNYQGVDFPSLDVSSMEMLHVDVWTPNLNTLRFFLIKFAPNVEQQVTITPTKNGWYSIDIPLSSYTLDKTQLRQFKLEGSPSGSTIYLDNIYFWKNPGTPLITGFSVPAKFLGDAPFTITPPTSNSTGAFSYTSSNTNVATVSGDVITVVGIGSTTITANQAADGSFNAGSTSTVFSVRYAPPATAAPIPTRDTSVVLSLFSDTYTNVSGTNWNPNWGQSTLVSDISVSGNTTKRYDNLNYQGVDFAAPVDATAYNHLHIDVYTPNCTTFRVFLISPGGVERQVTLTPTLNGWNSYDIALTSFAGVNFANITQMKFEGVPSGSSVVFYDNLFFWNAVVPTLGSFTVPAKELGDAPFALTAPTSNSNGSFSYSSSNTSVATVSGNMVTIIGIGTSTITATQAADGSYGSASATATLNVTLPALPQSPVTAAPTPTKPAFNVISLFSNAYNNRTVNTWSTVWDQADLLDTIVEGNDTKKYSNLNFSGIEFTGSNRINVTDAEYFHIDVWTPNTNLIRVKLVDFGANGSFGGGDDKEHELTLTAPTLSSWTSYDIPMSAFTGLTTKANLSQMIMVSNGSIVYFDNVYFWANTCINQVATPSVAISASANNVCAGTSVMITATPTDGGTNPNYNFMVNGSSVQNGASNIYTSSSLMNNSVVACVITRTDGCANDGNSNTIVMTVKAGPSMTPIRNAAGMVSSTASICTLGSTTRFGNLTPFGTWSSDNAGVASINNQGFVTGNSNGTATISYSLAGANGCVSTSTVFVTVAPATAPNAITSVNSVCAGSNITLSNTTPDGVWTTSQTSQATVNPNTGVLLGKSAGTATVNYTVTNAAGCTAFVSKTITVNALPSTPMISYAPGTVLTGPSSPFYGAPTGSFCVGKTFTLVGTPNGGTWSATGAASITNGALVSINAVGVGTIKYTFTNANGCVNSRTINGNGFSCAARGLVADNNINNDQSFTIYPNPAKNIVRLNIDKLVGKGQIVITDLFGKTVKTQALSMGINTIEIASFSKGFYLLSLITEYGKNTQKFVVE